MAAVGDPLSTEDFEWPTRLSFSPDGRYVAAVTDQELSGAGASVPIAYVWDVAQGGAPVVRYEFSAENFRRDVAFLPDSTQVVVAGTDGTAILDIASGQPVGQIAGAYPPLAVSPDGTTLAAATDASSGVVIGLFDLTTGERSAVLAGHRERLIRLGFSPDGSTLASGADDRLVITWDVARRQRLGVHVGHGAGVNALAFSADGKTLWSAGDDRAILAWDLQRADTLVHEASPAVTAGPPLPGNSVDMIIGPDGRYVAYPAADLTSFQVRDVTTGDLGPPSAVEDGEIRSFSRDGTRYVTVDLTGVLRIWETATGAALADSTSSGRLFSSFPTGAKAVFTPDGRHVLALESSATDPNGVGFVPESLVVLDATTLAPAEGEPVPLGYAGRTISVTPDGRHAVVIANTPGQGETKVLLVDLETRRIVHSPGLMAEFDQRGNGPRNNTVAPDGRTVGIGGTKGDVVVVDAVTGEVSPMLPAHDGFVESVTFAPDAATFITTGQDGAVKLWDRATWRLLYTLLPLGPNHRIRASYLRPDRVMIVDDTGVILEWDPRPDAWEAHACKVAGRNLTQAEWAESFPGQAYRVTCPEFPADE